MEAPSCDCTADFPAEQRYGSKDLSSENLLKVDPKSKSPKSAEHLESMDIEDKKVNGAGSRPALAVSHDVVLVT